MNLINHIDRDERENGINGENEIQVYQADNIGEINNLCREIEAVHDVFIDIALLVNNQGDQIDNIQTNIETTNTHVEGAKCQLIKAKKYQKKTRNCICRICIVITIFIGIIIIILLTTIPISIGKN